MHENEYETWFLRARGMRLEHSLLYSSAGAGVATAPAHTEDHPEPHVHPTAVIDGSVRLGWGCVVGPFVSIAKGVSIGDDTVIEAGVYIGEDVSIGSSSLIQARAVIRERSRIGSRCVIHSGVVIGCDGFGYAKGEDGLPHKIPQVGHVVIGDEVVVGSHSTIDRATFGRTVVEDGTRIGCLSQVAHNATVGYESIIGDRVGICGSCKIGSHVEVGSSSGLVGHIQIGDGSKIAPATGVTKDLSPGSSVAGMIGLSLERHLERRAILNRLPELLKRLQHLGFNLEEDDL